MGRMFENRKGTMFARWDRMAKAFTRISKDIVIAVKAGGPNPDANPALRRAIQNGKAVNMPKDKVQGAIDRAMGVGVADYEELLYEGYAPHGVAILVETATDNPVRTVANVRMYFRRGGGNLGTNGSVSFMFDRMGVFQLDPTSLDRDELELELIDHGLTDLIDDTGEKDEPIWLARCAFNDFGTLQAAIEAMGITPISADSEYLPQNMVELDDDQTTEVLALIDRIEQDDDVQKVFHTLA